MALRKLSKEKPCKNCKDKVCKKMSTNGKRVFCTGNKVFCKCETYLNAEIRVMSNL